MNKEGFTIYARGPHPDEYNPHVQNLLPVAKMGLVAGLSFQEVSTETGLSIELLEHVGARDKWLTNVGDNPKPTPVGNGVLAVTERMVRRLNDMAVQMNATTRVAAMTAIEKAVIGFATLDAETIAKKSAQLANLVRMAQVVFGWEAPQEVRDKRSGQVGSVINVDLKLVKSADMPALAEPNVLQLPTSAFEDAMGR